VVGAGDYSHDRLGQEDVHGVAYVLLEAFVNAALTCTQKRAKIQYSLHKKVLHIYSLL